MRTHLTRRVRRAATTAVTTAAALALVTGSTGIVTACAPDPADAPVSAADATSATDGASLVNVDIGAGLAGPAGLTATVHATGIMNAASLAIDASGALWVGTASFSDDGTDALFVVAQAGAEPVLVVGGLHTVLGLLWVDDELFVASKERVDAYSGWDGSSFAGRRNVVTFASGVGEVNGLARSSTGRISLGISAPCNACVVTDQHSAAVVSFLPDGSDLRVDATGIRAAVGLAYLPGTDVLFVTMNQRDDLGDATPGDWLAIVEAGQSWGFPDCYGQGGSACSAAPSPVAELDAHAAVSGVAIVTADAGNSLGTVALVAEWSFGKVQVVPIDAATPASTTVAVASVSGFSNPVAVLADGVGSVYVTDWATGIVYSIEL